jgi:pyridoxal 5'-phosphate synthase pdxS subunit
MRKLAKEMRVPVELLKKTAQLGDLPVPNFAAGGIATPADAVCAKLRAQAVFVRFRIFKSSNQVIASHRDSSRPL